ncbi:methylated-DNA--[protein]-cysteine S-methyltransferase [Umezawaea tangerina]|uniref:Methylated-DNA--protein-cysteine methyltransferase n=1 Tax=Umezawaea tangerina TaxID=84725 RepID=A0A2T0SZ52_9PSEU|nr:methylated-DNA--[protein]-cysteine S-methyltransferase [Umezawaea tangerina]PRY38695.1 methylated-DNA-[protein]-cysteine S-methyltransferase [Umezawaea tangerina]
MTHNPFDSLPEVDEPTTRRLHARLVSTATQEGLLDIAYRTLDSPVGPLLLATTTTGLIRVAFERQDHNATLTSLATLISPRVLHAPAKLDPVARQLDEYFAGTRHHFDLPLDFRLSKGFRRAVLTHLPAIHYGTTESYAQVATAAGSPKAVRAVGSACATNPLPLIVPCHRVVRSDGSYGQYAGGETAKHTLLTLEATQAKTQQH